LFFVFSQKKCRNFGQKALVSIVHHHHHPQHLSKQKFRKASPP